MMYRIKTLKIQRCGECKFFFYQDVNGNGYCDLSTKGRMRNQPCEIPVERKLNKRKGK